METAGLTGRNKPPIMLCSLGAGSPPKGEECPSIITPKDEERRGEERGREEAEVKKKQERRGEG